MTKRQVYFARTGKDEIEELRRTMMAKDPAMSGPVTNLEGGEYESSEAIRAASTDSGLTRSEIINHFGEDLGNKLLDGGFSSLSGMRTATDEDFLAIAGVGPAALAKIREVVSLEMPEEKSGLEEETPDEPQVEEAVDAEVETAEELVAEEADEEVSEEVLPEEPPIATEASPVAPPPPAPPEALDPMVEDVPFGIEGGMSVRVRRNKERAAKEEAERKRLADIESSLTPAPSVPAGVVDLGSVDVDFVPIPDPPVIVIDDPIPDTEPDIDAIDAILNPDEESNGAGSDEVVAPPTLPEDYEGGTEPQDPGPETVEEETTE